MPKVATLLISFVPLPEWVPGLDRARGMDRRGRGGALRGGAHDGACGAAGRLRVPAAGDEPRAGSAHRGSVERESAVARLLRGFPITIGIAAAFIVVFVTVPVLRVMALLRRRVEVHVPVVTDAASYHAVAAETARTLTEHGFAVREAKPGWWMTVPSRILLYFGGPAFRDHIPQRLAYFRGARLEVAVYPNALLLRGVEQDTAWAHGVVVEALTTAPALQTFDPRAQDIERQIHRVWSVYRENPRAHERAARCREGWEKLPETSPAFRLPTRSGR